tara:strand:- start:1654 stop:2499 length:846 start_codon:yes stop_codon:yes gene_type:complete
MTALTIASVGASLISGISATRRASSQAKAAADDRDEAETAAAAAFQEAEDTLGVNFMEGLSIQKTPYEEEREARLVTSQSLIDAVREGDTRGVAGTAGRILAADLEAQQDTTKEMSEEMQAIDLLKRQEDARLADAMRELKLKETEGAQAAAADAENRRVEALERKNQAFQNTLGNVLGIVPMFGGLGGGQTQAQPNPLDSFYNADALSSTGTQSGMNLAGLQGLVSGSGGGEGRMVYTPNTQQGMLYNNYMREKAIQREAAQNKTQKMFEVSLDALTTKK